MPLCLTGIGMHAHPLFTYGTNQYRNIFDISGAAS
jgi:hypothetical protein